MKWSKHKVAISGAVLVAGIAILWWLYRQEEAAAAAGSVAPGISSAGGMYYPATNISDPYAGLVVNQSFQTPADNFTNQATGYVPLYGFVGPGVSWG